MRRLPVVVVGLLSGAVVGGLLDGIVWPGSALALFRPQLTLLLVLGALVALVLRDRRAAIAGIAIASLGGVLLIATLRDPEAEPPPAGSRTVKVLTLNLWHRNDDVAAVAELIRRERPHIVALLELTPRWSRALAPALRPYRTRAVEPREGSIGIGLYARAHLGDPRLVRPVAGGRRAVEARLELADRAGALLVAHPPGVLLPGTGAAHERELAAIGDWARRHGKLSVVCGDLNAAPWTRSLRDARAKGALRAVFPGGLFAGSWPALVPPLRVAIDGCLVGEGIKARAELGPRAGSDHLPVLVELA